MPLRYEWPSYPPPSGLVKPEPEDWMTAADLLALLRPRVPLAQGTADCLLPTPGPQGQAPVLQSPSSTRTAGAEE